MFEKISNKLGIGPMVVECSITRTVTVCGEPGECYSKYGLGFSDQIVQKIDKYYGTLCDEYRNDRCCVFGVKQ